MERPLDTAEFGAFVEGLDYPMFVVTTTDGDELSGCLVGFTTQASIDPPRFLVCLSEKNRTFRVAQRAAWLAVHRLGEDQHGLAEIFGGETGDQTDKFAEVRWSAGPGGVPVLLDAPAYVVGRVLERHWLGDHVGFLLEPVAVDAVDVERDPLTLDDVEDVDPGHEA